MIFPMVANGNIAPSRFAKQDTTADNKCLQADAGAKIIAVTQRGTRNPPYSSLDDGFAAIAGESLQLYGPGETCVLELGGTVAAGDRLKADANGKGVTAGSGDEYGFRAGQAGTSGKLIEGVVEIGKLP